MTESSQNQFALQGQKRPVMLSEKIREVLRLEHYSLRTEEAYRAGLEPGAPTSSRHERLSFQTRRLEASAPSQAVTTSVMANLHSML